MKLLTLGLALLLPLAAGCAGPVSDGPAAPQLDPLGPGPVSFTSTDLARSTFVGEITRRTDSNGILHVTVPIRAVDYDQTVDTRFTFLDAAHALVDQPKSWQATTLHAGTFEYLEAAAPSPTARDFTLDIRPAQ